MLEPRWVTARAPGGRKKRFGAGLVCVFRLGMGWRDGTWA